MKAELELPKYHKPPVVEVAIGVQFEPLSEMRTAHFGAFWKRVEEDYPSVEDQAPLLEAPQPELLETPPLRRVWFSSAEQI